MHCHEIKHEEGYDGGIEILDCAYPEITACAALHSFVVLEEQGIKQAFLLTSSFPEQRYKSTATVSRKNDIYLLIKIKATPQDHLSRRHNVAYQYLRKPAKKLLHLPSTM